MVAYTISAINTDSQPTPCFIFLQLQGAQQAPMIFLLENEFLIKFYFTNALNFRNVLKF